MQVLVLILNKVDCLEDILKGFIDVGIYLYVIRFLILCEYWTHVVFMFNIVFDKNRNF